MKALVLVKNPDSGLWTVEVEKGGDGFDSS